MSSSFSEENEDEQEFQQPPAHHPSAPPHEDLFDVFPFASDDTEAQNAIWSIIVRILLLVQEKEMSPSISLVSILASMLDLIEEEILARPLDHREHQTADTSGTKTNPRIVPMLRIFNILARWKSLDDGSKKHFFNGRLLH